MLWNRVKQHIRFISQGTVDNIVGPDLTADPKALDYK